MIHLSEQLVFDEYYTQEPKADLIRIQKALFLHRDIYCTLDECGDIWQVYSSWVCAGWIFVPTKSEDIIHYIETDYNFTNYEDLINENKA